MILTIPIRIKSSAMLFYPLAYKGFLVSKQHRAFYSLIGSMDFSSLNFFKTSSPGLM